MLHFFATERFRKVNREFFASWGVELNNRVRLWSYERVPLRQPIPPGICIFTDLERLLPAELNFAAALADHFAAHPASYHVLNHPRRWLNRFDLQRRLFDAGINNFRAFRLHEVDGRVRYPVFVRRDNDHRKAEGLFQNAEELKQRFARLGIRDRLLKSHFMVVEFANTAGDDGTFRKYSAMRVEDDMVPRHILFSKNWLTKFPDLITEQTVAEESEYVHCFPHAAALRDIFRLAGIDYGRMDYGIKDGRLQIWEINSMPVIVPLQSKMNPLRLEVQQESAHRIVQAFRRLADRAPREPCSTRFDGKSRRRWWRVQWFGRCYGFIRR